MLTFEEVIQITPPYPLENLAPLEDILFFDIETTGFQADVSSLYLIGCLYYENHSFHMVQWFADSYQSEVDLLHHFFRLLNKRKTLIHFNGNGFDIPYLLKKCKQFQLDYSFDHCQNVDLYRKLKPYKNLFALNNYKQKTVEEFLQIERTDPYTGGELIQVYADYMKAKVAYKDTTEYLTPLLLHNKEDLKGMLGLTKILHYIDIFHTPQSLQWFHISKDFVEAIMTLPNKLPTPLNIKKGNYQLSVSEDKLFLSIQYFQGELKYFYPNYKDYFYLPEEDMAVHKSVASFVDKEYRQKATRSNCYLRKSGIFIPVYEKIEGFSIFVKEYNDKQQYIELQEEFTKDSLALSQWIHTILRHMAEIK